MKMIVVMMEVVSECIVLGNSNPPGVSPRNEIVKVGLCLLVENSSNTQGHIHWLGIAERRCG